MAGRECGGRSGRREESGGRLDVEEGAERSGWGWIRGKGAKEKGFGRHRGCGWGWIVGLASLVGDGGYEMADWERGRGECGGRTKRGAMDGGRESRVGSLCGSRRSGADTRGQRLI